jgi:hypothetical protein
LTDKYFLLPVPSEGILKAGRRLIDAQGEDTTDTRALLKRWYPRAEPQAVETILVHWGCDESS